MLDTCTLIWLSSKPENISENAAKIIDEKSTTCVVSHVSVWEMALKIRAGKMVFPKPLRRWITEQKDIWKFEWLTVSLDHILKTTELQDHHRDPFDRLLISQAQTANLPIITPDEFIRKYPVEVIW
jgi:PIN domain nuclease of toxin-antitoxin system